MLHLQTRYRIYLHNRNKYIHLFLFTKGIQLKETIVTSIEKSRFDAKVSSPFSQFYRVP